MGLFKSDQKKIEGKTAKEWFRLARKTEDLSKKIECYSNIRTEDEYYAVYNKYIRWASALTT